MLDFRILTFLDLCEAKSYTKTADRLHLTQPAVSQHIRHLEKELGAPLFRYAAKSLSLTHKGELFREYAQSMQANSEKIAARMKEAQPSRPVLTMGATLTIGEYVLPPLLTAYLKEYPDADLHLYVNNTQTLLEKLRRGEISMAFIEGAFEKADYAWRLFSREEFIPVCSPRSPYAKKAVSLDDLTGERLIVREKGSGTRQVLETILHEHSLSLASFAHVSEVGNFAAIKRLVADHLGITFLYREAAAHELSEGSLSPILLEGFHAVREFHFVYLKHNIFEKEILEAFSFFAGRLKGSRPTPYE